MASTLRGKGSRLILASGSTARAALLRAAGVEFYVIPASVDEGAIKRRHRESDKDVCACAMALARAKALSVAADHRDAVVIGADQILVADSEWLDKPKNLDEASTQLRFLSGRSHLLVTAAVAVNGDSCLWTATTTPKLTMRRFGECFLADYIAVEGEAVLGSVGGYQIEGRGAQLFSRIEGDYFSILGLPLIELLGFLRASGFLGK